MKRKLLGIMTLALAITLTGCSELLDGLKDKIEENVVDPLPPVVVDPDFVPTDVVIPTVTEPGTFKVTYDFNNGYLAESMVTKDNMVPKPQNEPTKMCAKFLYWCEDEQLTKKFNFDKPVGKDLIIHAKYEIDYMKLTNKVSSEAIKSNVRILGKYTNGLASTVQTSLGSGVIIHEDKNYYYALTNHHVVYKPAKYKQASYEVLDAYLNSYSMEIVYKNVDYDLALIKIKKDIGIDDKLPVIDIAKDILSKGEVIIAMGEPLGQSNTITYGTVLKTQAPFEPNPDFVLESNVTFKVINHTAPINSGSSGGALIDTNLNLVGVNFASSTVTSAGNEYTYSCTLPLNRVYEFFDLARNNK